MADFDVYDEAVKVNIVRDGKKMWVEFWQIHKGDVVFYEGTQAKSHFVAGEDAHISNDPDYKGWLVHTEGGMGFFPEDFGAKKKELADWIFDA